MGFFFLLRPLHGRSSSRWQISSYNTHTAMLTAPAVTSQLRPLSFIHVTVCVNTSQAWVLLQSYGSRTTHSHAHVSSVLASADAIYFDLGLGGFYVSRTHLTCTEPTQTNKNMELFAFTPPKGDQILLFPISPVQWPHKWVNGVQGAPCHWLMLDTVSLTISHFPGTGTAITHVPYLNTSADVFRGSSHLCILFSVLCFWTLTIPYGVMVSSPAHTLFFLSTFCQFVPNTFQCAWCIA